MFSPMDQLFFTLATIKLHCMFLVAAKQSQLDREAAIGKLANSSCLYLAPAGLLPLLVSVPNKSEITELKKYSYFHPGCQHEL